MAAFLTGCGGCFSCGGCGSSCGGSSSSKTLTRSNWFTGTSYNGIHQSFVKGSDEENEKNHFSPEIISYTVTYDKDSASNGFVELDYSNGHFKTEFYAVKNWSSRIESAIPEGYAHENSQEIVYYYKTTLTISVKYTMKNSGASKDFDDEVTTESYFRAAGKSLQPVYSKQVIKSTSPANYQPASLEDSYKEIAVTYENFYNNNCTKVLSVTYENGETSTKEYTKLNKIKDTLLDNSSLYIAARSMLKPNSSPSETVVLFSAAAGGTDKYTINGSGAQLTESERADFTAKLSDEKVGLYKPTGENDEGVGATAVSISYAGGNLHGTTQTVWYAAITNKDNNISRSTMLKLSVPLSFNLGTLNYNLNEIESTLWNE